MRFLVDTNLPPTVATIVASLGHDARHTSDVGLESAKDREIWQHAKSNELCIVTKDEDFVLLKAADPDGPCVVWVRIGNAIRRVIVSQRLGPRSWPGSIGAIRSLNCAKGREPIAAGPSPPRNGMTDGQNH